MPRDHSNRPDSESYSFEAITPINLSRAAESSTSTSAGHTSSLSKLVVFALLITLLIAGIGVFFYLPEAVVQQQADAARNAAQNFKDNVQTTEKPAATSPPVTVDSAPRVPANELAALQLAQQQQARDQAQEVLETLLKQQATLEKAGVKLWAADRFAEAVLEVTRGDELFVNKDYVAAREAFSRAVPILNELVARIEPELAAAIEKGQASLNEKDAASANRHFERALTIDPDSSAAARGLERAGNLDQLLALLSAGKAHEDQDELQAAQESYQKAVKLDGESEEARQALNAVNSEISSRSFNRFMSEGFAALEKADYASARKSFSGAGRIHPQSAEVSEALAQVDSQQKLQTISMHREQADALNAQEQWRQAADAYNAALDIDPNLVFAREGKAYSLERLAITQQLAGYLQSPGRLSAQNVHDQASAYLESLKPLSDKGPKLSAQMSELARQLQIAATPVLVRIVSDNQTRVAVHQVGQFDVFLKKDLQLRPGTYTAVGSRTGYRDVRKVFDVAPDKGPISVIVKCEEPI